MLFISMDHRRDIVSPASKAVRPPIQRTATVVVGGGVCVFASVSGCARACVRACVSDVFAIYDNDILPRLIIIIITIIIVYFIQIRHTDDFPQTGNRLVYCRVSFPWRDGIWLVMKRHEKVHSEFVRNRVL